MEPERIFKRKIYNLLLQWKESSNGKSALLIEGARRVGKSTIVDAFARNEVKSSSYKTHTSMDEFCKKFSSRITNDRYLIYAKDYAHKESVRYIPAYLTLFL